MNYTITNNKEFNSLEIAFDCKPSEEIRDILKEMRFRWHSVKKVWYGYEKEEVVKNALDGGAGQKPKAKTNAPKKAEKTNKYGVKVGDIFRSSWGWEQTNVDFFQVVALVGECSVRVREVCPAMVDENPTCSMAADRTYKMTSELLPPVSRSIFIKDQENGDLKRIKPGYDRDPELAKLHCSFNVDSFATAFKCTGETETCYESWYA